MPRKRKLDTQPSALDQIETEPHKSFGRIAVDVDLATRDVERSARRRTLTRTQRRKVKYDETRTARIQLRLPGQAFEMLDDLVDNHAGGLNVPKYQLIQYRLAQGMLRCFAERIDLTKYRKQAPKHLAIKRGIDFVMEVPALQAGDVAADKRRLYDLTPDQKDVLEKTATMLRVPQGNLAAFWIMRAMLRAVRENEDLRPVLQPAPWKSGTAVAHDFVLPIPDVSHVDFSNDKQPS